MKPSSTEAVVVVNRRAAARLRQGHVWVYRSDVHPIGHTEGAESNGKPQPEPTADGADRLPTGGLVSVKDEKGNLIGAALYSSSSQIALRMLSSGPVTAETLPSLLRDRLLKAVDFRRQLPEIAGSPAQDRGSRRSSAGGSTNACRLVFSEADQLPGLIVDRYNDILTIQVLTQAMDAPEVRELIIATLAEAVQPAAIVERVDSRIRELEQLPVRESGVLWGEGTETEFLLNGIRFQYEALTGQKTGSFLDQRENYLAAARYAGGSALDVFCYQGGFSLHLARAGASVTGVDSSRPALEAAERNAALNPELGPIEWLDANAFDLLRDYASSISGRQYDLIVLDPPALAKSRRELPSAIRGYKELNLRALKMLRPSGVLVTCSCSFHVSEAEFLEVLRAAAGDARRSPRVLEKRGQAQDHPVLLNVPETSYLKCVILQV